MVSDDPETGKFHEISEEDIMYLMFEVNDYDNLG